MCKNLLSQFGVDTLDPKALKLGAPCGLEAERKGRCRARP